MKIRYFQKTKKKKTKQKMQALLSISFLLFINPIFSSASHLSDRFLKSVPPPPHHNASQEYLEVTRPLLIDQLIRSCSVQVLRHNFSNTVGSPPVSVLYFPPSDCPSPWHRVALHFTATCRGEQYDRIAAVWLGGVEMLRTSTAEPTETGILWKVRKDVTRYSSLLVRSNLTLTVMLENVVNVVFTGVYHVNVSFIYYNGTRVSSFAPDVDWNRKLALHSGKLTENLYQAPADLIIPISDDGEHGCWFRIRSESDIPSRQIKIPVNTLRAVLEVYVSFHGNDEFWYSNPPDSYIRLNNITTGRGHGAYREIYVSIDGIYVGSELPFPVIFTGGINPLFWEPVVAIGAFDLPSYDFDLSPFLGLLLDGEFHSLSLGVTDGISYWLVDANLHIWLDHHSSAVRAQSLSYEAPALIVKRTSRFKQLDGSFNIIARRKTQFSGWVNSSSGNIITHILQQFRFKSSIHFESNGTRKVVNHKIVSRTESKMEFETGGLLTRAVTRKRYPLSVITLNAPRMENGSYLSLTNVSHGFIEKYTNGRISRSVYNSQQCWGWMMVMDHSVVNGGASTNQSFSYSDEFGCYSRTVAATNGTLIADNSTIICSTSM